MAETEQIDDQQPDDGDCTTFQWDENAQLYFHSSTGFYYSPTGGWYYSSRDGLYYKFENGNYVLLDTSADESKVNSGGEGNDSIDLVEGQQCNIVSSEKDGQFVSEVLGTVIPDPAAADFECLENHKIEEPSPPSEWLEDTLIELFLAGYPSQSTSDDVLPTQTYDANTLDTTAADRDSGDYELEEGEWISEENNGLIVSNRNDADQGTSWEEENWKAQYGQYSEPNEISISGFHFLDLWDWEIIPGTRREDGKGHTERLTGRLVKCSSKLHPSLPSGGTRLKTSPICQVHADLVRVKSGQIYKLRRPSKHYLESLSVYDCSNPTSGWGGYPELSVSREIDGHSVDMEGVMSSTHRCASNKDKSIAYRDRAAERRAFHGGFGVGPGQKKSYDAESSIDANPEAMSFLGSGSSYARRLLENMGWKEGEALGKSNSTNGLLEPLQATGNNGNAGLGWDQGKIKVFYSTGR